MERKCNTTMKGNNFSDKTIDEVWDKAIPVSWADKNIIRKDRCGATIYRASYGKASEYGWEIDHIKPVSKGGTDELSNLQPLHWANNRHKDDDFPEWTCFRK